MSKSIKIAIMSLAWLLYSLLAWQWGVRPCCGDEGGSLAAADSAAVHPLDFGWGEATPVKQAGYENWRAALLAGRQPGRELELTGLYYESEAAPAGYANLGFARAEAVARLLGDELPAAQLQLRARALEDDSTARSRRFAALVADWKEVEKPDAKLPQEQAEVEQLADRTIIRFPYNSDQMVADPVIDDYLDRLLLRLADSGERVQLSGHTDNSGTPDYNLRLGQQRADAIRALLVSKGLAANRITTASKGQTQPVDSNDTEEGRRNNRRVELRILPAD